MAAGLACLFELVILSGYYLVAFLLGSLTMAAAPFALALLVVI